MEEQLSQIILKNRPSISQSSIKTYVSILRTLYKKLAEKNDDINFFINEKEKIIKFILEKNNNQSIKTSLSALYVLTNDEQYKTPMLEYAGKVNQAYKEQKTNPERKENMPTLDEIKSKYDLYKNNLVKNPNIENYILYFIVAVTCCVLFPPRRALDWTAMKLKNASKEDNYIDKNCFVFNKFKTAKFTKEEDKRLPVPDELMKFIKKFKKISDNDYFIYNPKTGKPYDSSQFSKILNKIFGPKIAVDTIRSIFLSNLYSGLPPIKELENIATQMGQTGGVNTALSFYVKKD